MKLRKWELLIIAGIVAICFGVAWAIDETVTVSMTPKSLTVASYGNFTHGVCKVEDNSIYFTIDGISTPTSTGTVGVKVDIGQTINFWLADHIKYFKAVRSSSTDAKLKCAYW